MRWLMEFRAEQVGGGIWRRIQHWEQADRAQEVVVFSPTVKVTTAATSAS